MTSPAWRVVTIEHGSALFYREGRLAVQNDKEGTTRFIPLFDVRTVIVVSLQVKITAALINELQKRQISLIFCDEKKLPIGEFVGYYDHHAAPARLFEQIQWKKEKRKEMWNWIVRQKIKMQCNLLQKLNLVSDWKKWQSYLESVTDGDRSNREGQAARLYFNSLFGKLFQRRRESSVNAALNYGYAILCSVVTRSLTSHGYHPGLGIAHRGGTNPLNLSYDLIEPFRPFVDEVVYHRKGKELDNDFKKELITVTNANSLYRGKRMSLTLTIDQYILDVTKSLNSDNFTPGEPGF